MTVLDVDDIINHYREVQDILFDHAVTLPEYEQEEHLKKAANIMAESFISQKDDVSMKLFTNFTVDEFLELYENVHEIMELRHHSDSMLSPQSKFLMTLCFLKYNETWNILSKNFGISKSYASDVIYETIDKCFLLLENKYIKWLSVTGRLTNTNVTFLDWPLLLGSLDATVQRINKPKNQGDYYSGKHKCHVVKIQALVSPLGLLMHHTGYVPGKIHDFALFKDSGLEKKLIEENDKCQKALGSNATLLADSGYQGIMKRIPGAVTPFKKSKNHQLTAEQKSFNKKISHRRIIVENWFARLKTIWGITSFKFTKSLIFYNHIWSMCAALTNFHILKHPLQRLEKGVEEDSDEENESEEEDNTE